MATANHVQGVLGEFKPVLDSAGGTFTANQVQGVFGEFKPVLDNAQTAAVEAATIVSWKSLLGVGFCFIGFFLFSLLLIL